MDNLTVDIHAPNGIHDPSWKNFQVTASLDDKISNVFNKFSKLFISGYHASGVWFSSSKNEKKLDLDFPIRRLQENGKIKLIAHDNDETYETPIKQIRNQESSASYYIMITILIILSIIVWHQLIWKLQH